MEKMNAEQRETLGDELRGMIADNQLITADDARKLVAESREKPDITKVVHEKLQEVSKLIEKMARLGKSFVDYSTNYLTVVALTKELTKLGFTVKTGNSVEYIRIGWGETLTRERK